MPSLMSVALTEPQVRARTKTVTRRMGWRKLKPGDRLTLCPKVMGFRKGEHPERIVDVEVISVRRERLDLITPDEVTAEGFPRLTPAEFVAFFCGSHKGCTPDTEVTRIEWRYLCRHCGKPIERCHPARTNPLCKGWRHVGYDSQPVIGHCCEGRMINPEAEPGEDGDRA
jgi:hypothetical protein